MRSLAIISYLLFLAGCPTTPNPFYCDEQMSCQAAGDDYICDTTGTFGQASTCIPDPYGAACDENTPCLDPSQPTCPMSDDMSEEPMQCRMCLNDGECSNGGTCTAGACVLPMCTVACTRDNPLCSNGSCIDCEMDTLGDGVCSSLFSDTPYCAEQSPGDNYCAECREESNCSDGRICDPATDTCQPCTTHEQCASNVCMQGGCVAEDQVIRVADANGIDQPNCGGTSTIPCKTIYGALELMSAADPLDLRRTILVTDTSVDYRQNLTITDLDVNIIGNGAIIDADVQAPTLDITGTSKVYIENVTIKGAFNGEPGIRCISPGASFTGTQLMVSGNSGQGILIDDECVLDLQRSRLENNEGGGLDIHNANFTVVNNFIVNNGDRTAQYGGVRISREVSLDASRFDFNTIVGNEGNTASGVFCFDLETLNITGNIMYSGQGGPSVRATGECKLSYSNAEGFVSSDKTNIDAMPLFVNIIADNFRLAQDSPGIDEGPACEGDCVDYDGTARPLGNGFDMGAHEYIP